MGTFTLQNETLELQFDAETGALVGLIARDSGWRILDRHHLGMSFRLLLPLAGRRKNLVHGERQRATTVDVDQDGRRATIGWDAVTSEHGGRHEVAVTLVVALSARQAVFTISIDNRSELTVENVYCPYLGDVRRPAADEWFKTFGCSYADPQQASLWPTFDNLRGYWGFDYPVQLGAHSYDYGNGVGNVPATPFLLLRSPTQGLYVGVGAPECELITWFCELLPGYGSAIDSRVPEGLTIGETDVATRFAAVHVPYVRPGEKRRLTPIALEPYRGTWHDGADIYKRWRDGWMGRPQVPAWVDEPHSWYEVRMNSPEDDVRVRYADLVQLGEECAEQGVKALHLIGWNKGGQDRGNPYHDHDPGLGTVEEFKSAIDRVRALGVKVILFSKFTWLDRTNPDFEQLVRLAIKDTYGDYYLLGGYQYDTVTQAMDVNTIRMVPMCFLSEDYLALCDREFRKMLDLGVDGIVYDESQHHTPAMLCFDRAHGHRLGASVYANDRTLIDRFSRLADASAEFLLGGEGCYDWEFDSYHLSYIRSWNKDHVPLSRYLLPRAQLMTTINGFRDRNMINQCLLYRYLMVYEPYNNKGRLGDFPLTTAYGRKMDALRSEFRDYFWDGEFRDTRGASVTVGGRPHHPYAVFRSRSSGRPGVVIANYDERLPIEANLEMEDGSTLGRYRLVDSPEWLSVDGGIAVPPESAAVVIA